jgi:hypothetical protein
VGAVLWGRFPSEGTMAELAPRWGSMVVKLKANALGAIRQRTAPA